LYHDSLNLIAEDYDLSSKNETGNLGLKTIERGIARIYIELVVCGVNYPAILSISLGLGHGVPLPLQIRVSEFVGAWPCRAPNPMKKMSILRFLTDCAIHGVSYAEQY
jgi:hypothetical protein